MRPVLDETAARRRFRELIARDDVPLAEAALAVAQEEYPELAPEGYLARLDELGQGVQRRLGAAADPASKLRALRTVLFEEEKFRGNADAYYDPRNSFLNDVLDRRLGIPITLSIVYIEVAARVGLPVEGVGFPGHFLVKHAAAGREIFIDPFHGGELLSSEDCVARFHAIAPGRALEPHHLAAVTHHQILRRLLHNLRKIYVDTGDDVRALWVMDRLVLLAPGDPVAQRDRGLIEARLGGTTAALTDLEAYLASAPDDSDDADAVRGLVDQLRQKGAGFLN